jgi:FkbM family methyltransferase
MSQEHDWERFHELNGGETFVELGSFKGEYILHALEKGAITIAVEPLPEAIRELAKLPTNIIGKAVWTKKGIIDFSKCLGDEGYKEESKIVELGNLRTESEIIQVRCDTLDNMIKELGITHIDLLAADIEGAETEVFAFGKETLKICDNVAIAVYHLARGEKIVLDILTELGFKIQDKGAIIYATQY